MEIKVGDLVFTHTNSLLARMINLAQSGGKQKNIPSHIAIVTSIHSNIVALIEANLTGVKIVSLDTYDKSKVWFARMKEPRDIQKGLLWLNDQLYAKYDYTSIIGIVLRSFFRILGPKVYNRVRVIKTFLDSRTKFFCSELVSYYGMITGEKLWHAHPSVTTPADLFRSDEIKIYAEDWG